MLVVSGSRMESGNGAGRFRDEFRGTVVRATSLLYSSESFSKPLTICPKRELSRMSLACLLQGVVLGTGEVVLVLAHQRAQGAGRDLGEAIIRFPREIQHPRGSPATKYVLGTRRLDMHA